MFRSEQAMTEERNEPTNPAEESPELDARLNQIETATEEDSNVNEDFVHWLKTSFPIYVLAFAAAAGGYIWYFQDQATQQANTIDAWREFRAASNPDSLLELASEKEVTLPHLSVQARLQAGNLHLQAVRRNRPVNAEADSTETLSDEDREAIWNNPSKYVGRIVEIRADAITKAEDSAHYSLRFPRFKGFRGIDPGEKL